MLQKEKRRVFIRFISKRTKKKGSGLKDKTKKTKSDADITSCKKQRNYVAILNQKVKCNCLNNLDTNNGAEPF